MMIILKFSVNGEKKAEIVGEVWAHGSFFRSTLESAARMLKKFTNIEMQVSWVSSEVE